MPSFRSYMLAMVAFIESDVPVPDVSAIELARKKQVDTGTDMDMFPESKIFLITGSCSASSVVRKSLILLS